MAAFLKVQERGQVTLPKSVRKRLDINPGDVLVCVELENGNIQLAPLRPLVFDDVFGTLGESKITSARAVDEAIEAGEQDAAQNAIRRLHE